jgi:hypothetical protein
MEPRKDPILRKRSGSLVRFEPINTSLIEQDMNHVDSFKCLVCWRFCQKLQGYHLEVSRDFVHNYRDGKTKIGPLEIHLTADMIVGVTEIPRIGEKWFKAKKIEKEDWCKDMLRPEHIEADLVRGVIRKWLIEDYDKLLFIIQMFFTCEGRYN